MRKSIIENGDKDLIFSLCVLNCINGNVSINSEAKSKLLRHKKSLKALLDKKKNINLANKRKILQKGGAFLPILLSSVVSAFANQLFEK